MCCDLVSGTLIDLIVSCLEDYFTHMWETFISRIRKEEQEPDSSTWGIGPLWGTPALLSPE